MLSKHHLTSKIINLPLSLLCMPDKDLESRELIPSQVAAMKDKLRPGFSPGHSLVGVAFGYECLGGDALSVDPPSVSMTDAQIIQCFQQHKVRVQIISGAHRLEAITQLVAEDRGNFSNKFSTIPVTVYLFDHKSATVRENIIAHGMQLNNLHMGAAVSWEARILFARKEFERRWKETASHMIWKDFADSINKTEESAILSRMVIKNENTLRNTIRFALMEPSAWKLLKQVLERNLEHRVKKTTKEPGDRRSGEQDKGVAEHLLVHLLALPTEEQVSVLSDIWAGRVKGTTIKDKCELNRASGVLCANIPVYLGLKDWKTCSERFPKTFNAGFIQLWMDPTRKLINCLDGKFKSVAKASFDQFCPPGLKRQLDLMKESMNNPAANQPAAEVGNVQVFNINNMSVASMNQLTQDHAALAKVSDALHFIFTYICIWCD